MAEATGNDLKASERMIAAIVSCFAERGVARRDLSLDDLDLGASDEPDLFFDALQWLEIEGIIYSTEEHKFLLGETVAFGFALTSHGFQLLGQKLEGELTLGTAVKEVSEGRRSFAGAGDFIGGILGGFTKSISS
jgi:hypothetical protein